MHSHTWHIMMRKCGWECFVRDSFFFCIPLKQWWWHFQSIFFVQMDCIRFTNLIYRFVSVVRNRKCKEEKWMFFFSLSFDWLNEMPIGNTQKKHLRYWFAVDTIVNSNGFEKIHPNEAIKCKIEIFSFWSLASFKLKCKWCSILYVIFRLFFCYRKYFSKITNSFLKNDLFM